MWIGRKVELLPLPVHFPGHVGGTHCSFHDCQASLSPSAPGAEDAAVGSFVILVD